MINNNQNRKDKKYYKKWKKKMFLKNIKENFYQRLINYNKLWKVKVQVLCLKLIEFLEKN